MRAVNILNIALTLIIQRIIPTLDNFFGCLNQNSLVKVHNVFSFQKSSENFTGKYVIYFPIKLEN